MHIVINNMVNQNKIENPNKKYRYYTFCRLRRQITSTYNFELIKALRIFYTQR